MHFFKRKYFLFIFFIVLVLGFFLYQQKSASDTVKKKQKTYKVKRQALKENLSLSGKIDSEEKEAVKFQSSGMLSWVGVKEGDIVKKNQALASLDQREISARLKKYLNSFLKERSQFDQTKDDYKEPDVLGLTDDQRREAYRLIDQAQNDLDNSVIDVEIQNLTLQYANIYSPIDGIVIHIDTPNAGVNITPAGAEFDIVNPDKIYFSATADQTDVIKFHPGMKAEIILDPYPEDNIIAYIKDIGFTPKSGETGTVYEIKLQMKGENAGYKYRIGMTGDADFVLKEKDDVIVIPSSFLKAQDSKPYVIVKVADTQEKRFVKTGESTDTDTEIISGLKEGDTIYD